MLETVLDSDSVVGTGEADEAELDVAEEDSSLDVELKPTTGAVFVLVCWAVVCSAAVEVTSAKAEELDVEGADASSALQ